MAAGRRVTHLYFSPMMEVRSKSAPDLREVLDGVVGAQEVRSKGIVVQADPHFRRCKAPAGNGILRSSPGVARFGRNRRFPFYGCHIYRIRFPGFASRSHTIRPQSTVKAHGKRISSSLKIISRMALPPAGEQFHHTLGFPGRNLSGLCRVFMAPFDGGANLVVFGPHHRGRA